jgi:hypothetical protein
MHPDGTSFPVAKQHLSGMTYQNIKHFASGTDAGVPDQDEQANRNLLTYGTTDPAGATVLRPGTPDAGGLRPLTPDERQTVLGQRQKRGWAPISPQAAPVKTGLSPEYLASQKSADENAAANADTQSAGGLRDIASLFPPTDSSGAPAPNTSALKKLFKNIPELQDDPSMLAFLAHHAPSVADSVQRELAQTKLARTRGEFPGEERGAQAAPSVQSAQKTDAPAMGTPGVLDPIINAFKKNDVPGSLTQTILNTPSTIKDIVNNTAEAVTNRGFNANEHEAFDYFKTHSNVSTWPGFPSAGPIAEKKAFYENPDNAARAYAAVRAGTAPAVSSDVAAAQQADKQATTMAAPDQQMQADAKAEQNAAKQRAATPYAQRQAAMRADFDATVAKANAEIDPNKALVLRNRASAIGLQMDHDVDPSQANRVAGDSPLPSIKGQYVGGTAPIAKSGTPASGGGLGGPATSDSAATANQVAPEASNIAPPLAAVPNAGSGVAKTTGPTSISLKQNPSGTPATGGMTTLVPPPAPPNPEAEDVARLTEDPSAWQNTLFQRPAYASQESDWATTQDAQNANSVHVPLDVYQSYLRADPKLQPYIKASWEQADRDAAQQTRDMATMQEQQKRNMAIDKSYSDRWQQIQNDRMSLRSTLMSQDIDPKRWWNSKSTGQQLMSSLGMIIAGAGAGLLGGPNQAFEQINRIAERDMDAQRMNIGREENLLSDLVQQGHSIDDAYRMGMTATHEWAASEIQKSAMQDKDPTSAQNKAMIVASIQQQSQQMDQKRLMDKANLDKAQAQADVERYKAIPGESLPGYMAKSPEAAEQFREFHQGVMQYRQALRNIEAYNQEFQVSHPDLISKSLATATGYLSPDTDVGRMIRKAVAGRLLMKGNRTPSEEELKREAEHFTMTPDSWSTNRLHKTLSRLDEEADDQISTMRDHLLRRVR